jgi:hypothetical protein
MQPNISFEPMNEKFPPIFLCLLINENCIPPQISRPGTLKSKLWENWQIAENFNHNIDVRRILKRK